MKYVCIILVLVIPVWRKLYQCPLDIPTNVDEIRKVITSKHHKFSIKNLIPMPTIEEFQDHCYSPLLSLIGYTAMSSNSSSQAKKPRYQAWMKSKCCTTFIKKLKSTCRQSKRQSVAVFMVFWRDGFDSTTSMNINRHLLWMFTITVS